MVNFPFQKFVTPRVDNSIFQQDVRQLDEYVRMPNNSIINPILFSGKNEAARSYSILQDQKNFVSKYMLHLLSEEQLEVDILMEQRMIEERKKTRKKGQYQVKVK